MESGPQSGGINRDAWLKAVEDAEAKSRELPDSDSLTVQEFAALIGMNRFAAMDRIRALVAMGKAEKTKKKIRRTDGVVITATAYRLLT